MSARIALLLAAGLTAWTLLPTGQAEANSVGEDLGRCRVTLTDNRVKTGDVVDEGDSYLIEEMKGIKVRYPKSQVRKIERLGEAVSAVTTETRLPGRGSVSDEQIAKILGSDSIDAELRALLSDDENIDLSATLELDQDSLADMLRIAGKQAKSFETKHFIFVYTSDESSAKALAARLESTYDWCVLYVNQLGIPKAWPDSKLEIFYFGTYDEFVAYQTLYGFYEPGVLGFYVHDENRSAFFKMETYPPVAEALERSKDKNLPPDERIRLKNRTQRWADWFNYAVVQHEAAHHVHFNIGIYPRSGDTLRWMVEGLATHFEVPLTDIGGGLAAINHGRLKEFRKLFGEKGEQLVANWQYARDFILRDIGGYDAYVLGWALIEYLYRKHPEAYGKWARMLADRDEVYTVDPTTQQQQFEECFGTVDEKWVKEFVDYISAIVLVPSKALSLSDP